MKFGKIIANGHEICRFSETVRVENSNYVFEILRSGETILLVDNEPKSVVWHDNGPSSVHYYVINGSTLDREVRDRLDKFESLTQQNVLTDQNLLTIFEVYKPLLKSGLYRFFYTPAHSYEATKNFFNSPKLRVFELILPEKKDVSRPSLYLSEGVFMFTQSIKTLDTDRINYFETQILEGKSSTVITLGMQPEYENPGDIPSQFEDSYPQFIIDGHHKAMAYHSINKDRRKKGRPFTILVPSIFSIVRIPEKNKGKDTSMKARKEILSKILTNEEIIGIIKFYENG